MDATLLKSIFHSRFFSGYFLAMTKKNGQIKKKVCESEREKEKGKNMLISGKALKRKLQEMNKSCEWTTRIRLANIRMTVRK